MNEETKPGLSAEEMSKILYPYPDLSVFNNEFDKENIMYRENRCRQAFILGHKKASEQTTALQQENQRLREANEWGEKLNGVARNVLKEATKVYCHYNEIIKNKNESMDFKTLKELDAALSEYESTKIK